MKWSIIVGLLLLGSMLLTSCSIVNTASAALNGNSQVDLSGTDGQIYTLSEGPVTLKPGEKKAIWEYEFYKGDPSKSFLVEFKKDSMINLFYWDTYDKKWVYQAQFVCNKGPCVNYSKVVFPFPETITVSEMYNIDLSGMKYVGYYLPDMPFTLKKGEKAAFWLYERDKGDISMLTSIEYLGDGTVELKYISDHQWKTQSKFQCKIGSACIDYSVVITPTADDEIVVQHEP